MWVLVVGWCLLLHVHLVCDHPGPGVSFRGPPFLGQPLMSLGRRLLVTRVGLARVELLVGVLLEDKGLVGPSGPVVGGSGHASSLLA